MREFRKAAERRAAVKVIRAMHDMPGFAELWDRMGKAGQGSLLEYVGWAAYKGVDEVLSARGSAAATEYGRP